MLDIQKNPSPASGADRMQPGSAAARQSPELPPGRDVEAFERAMSRTKPDAFAQGRGGASDELDRPDELFRNTGRRHDIESGEALERRPEKSNPEGRLNASDFIDAMFGRSPTDAFAPAVARAEVAAAGNVDFPEGELNALVSRILVNSPEKGATEVRLTLSDNALRGTEITLLRDTAGALSVKIVAADPRTFQTLVASRNELVSALEAQETAGVSVVMEEGADANDTRRRSRGLDAFENQNKASSS